MTSARRTLVLATLNPGKARELADLLEGVRADVRALAAWPGAALPPETGATYRENALAKACAAARQTDELALGDDSGLEVDALGSAPGIRSARFGGPGLDDAGRVRRLLEALAGVPAGRRTARFRCVVALVSPDGREDVGEGVVEGCIAESPRGAGGFGYDPVFLYEPLGLTLAELPTDAKARISHRARALVALGPALARYYEPAGG